MNDETIGAFDGRQIRVMIDLRSYRLSAVKKAGYRIAARCTLILGSPLEHDLPVTFTFKPGTDGSTANEAVRAYFQELLDQELRESVVEETAPLRALILAQAFSRTDLIRRG